MSNTHFLPLGDKYLKQETSLCSIFSETMWSTAILQLLIKSYSTSKYDLSAVCVLKCSYSSELTRANYNCNL